MWETDSYKTHEDHMQLYEALEKSMNRDHSEELLKDLAKACKKKKKRRDSLKTPLVSPPPPLPPSTNQEGQSKGSAAPSSSKTAAFAEYQAWMMTDTRLRPSISLTSADLQMDDDMAPDAQAQSSDDEDIENAHIPETGDIAMFMDWFYKRQGITELKPQDLEGPAFKLVKVFHPNVIHIQYQIEECHKLLTDNMDESILRYNVSKPLPLGGPPEQMVPDQMWIEEEYKYDIADIAVRTHMRILSVVRIEVFSIHLVIRQRVEDFQLGIESYQTQLNLPNLDGMPQASNTSMTTRDGTLQQIDDALDYRVKEFKINRMNPGLNIRF
uniref:Uncharacterized protein n=1 Tax=Tanacetum cinerariifolium TaxID=118510 RepID=A0A6L2NPZ0_TANCI|nr:hypothetical protein [Tanacetum cinerariifolium]